MHVIDGAGDASPTRRRESDYESEVGVVRPAQTPSCPSSAPCSAGSAFAFWPLPFDQRLRFGNLTLGGRTVLGCS